MPTHLVGPRFNDNHSFSIQLLESAARTASGTFIVSDDRLSQFSTALILLNVTAAATEVGDLLDVYIQKNVGTHDSVVWTDFVHFTQVLGNGGAKQYVAELTQEDITSGMHAVQDAALPAGVNGGPWGNDWRIKWVVTDANANASFTFSLQATLVG